MTQLHKPNILIYRNHLLAVSETFIFNQSIKLNKYEAFFLGSKQYEGQCISLPENRVHIINYGEIKGFFRDIFFKLFGIIPRDVIKWIGLVKPVLLHAHFGPDGALAMPLSKRLRIPLILSLLGSDITLYQQYAKKSFYSQQLFLKKREELIKRVSAVIVPSEFLQIMAIERGFPEHKIHLIRHGVDLCKFDLSGRKTEFGHIVFVGRLVPLKGLNFLLQALSQIKKDHPEIFLTVIGDGPMRKEYESIAQKTLGNRFIFLGAQQNEIVLDLLSRAYIFSTPSIRMPNGTVEAFGLVFVEAQAMGVPVVSFACGGIPEVVEHGKTGLLAKEGDVNELAQNIKTILTDQDLHDTMSQNAIERVRIYFDLNKQNNELEALYDKIVTEN